MILKERTESEELKIHRSLNTRMELSNKEKYHYLNLEKGYEGELKFDQLTENIKEERYFINDLLLEMNNSYFQIDSLIISQGTVHLSDIKNHQGDCYLEQDKLYNVKTKREYKNPLDQLKRSTTLFRQLLKNFNYNYLIDPSVVFVNPEFTLYQDPMNQPFVLPTQLNRFINDFNQVSSKLNEGHAKLAQTLLSLHKTKNPFISVPDYHYDQLQKGMFCRSCKSFFVYLNNNTYICKKCGSHEKIEQAVVRHIEELRLLFPDLKLTTPLVADWCQTDLNDRTIRRVLQRNHTAVGTVRHTFYK
ncbi:nuclease-related domain-containing protein [Niallia sp. Krafla_26]|uniref:nuclease-related domain-containing protein n=1 Tax=Niallia sp. Krafla_26 TaxID=3064703 RepID=UPI003D1677DE